MRIVGAHQMEDVTAATPERIGNAIETFIGTKLITDNGQDIVQLLTLCTLDNNPLDARSRGFVDAWVEGRAAQALRDGAIDEIRADILSQ